MLYDAHCHYQFEELSPFWPQIVPELEALPIGGAIVNGTHPDEDWDAVDTLAAAHPWVIPSYGIHPWDVATRPDDWQLKFIHRLESNPRALVGEIGLDRWILEPARAEDPDFAELNAASIEEQAEVFRWQLRWAADHNRAASIHVLRAWGPLLAVLKDTPVPKTGFLLHAYGGSPEMVPQFVEMGAYFSYSTGHVDPRKTRQRKAFQNVPLDRLLVETDAPAMAPPHPRYPWPGDPSHWMTNHPANLAQAYADLAMLRGIAPAALEEKVAENFARLTAHILP